MAEVPKIAIIISHPIQHFCPQYASLAQIKTIGVKVFFASTLGFEKYTDPDFGEEISWDNLRLDAFDHVFLNKKNLPADKMLDAPSLENALNDYSPDMLIVYGYFQKYQRRAYRWAKKNNVWMAYISDSERKQKRNPVKEWIKYPFIRKYFSGINYFLSVGNANEEFYRHYGVASKKMIRMHFPIDIFYYNKKFPCKEQLRKSIRTDHHIGNDETVLSVVGKLVPWKNQADIIDAMVLLERRNIITHLFIIGSGAMLEELKKKAMSLSKSKVHFTGFINPGELPSYYAATDIYVHPAAVEPHSLAISEAIYMGCPVIISDRCGSYGENDDVQEERNGLVYSCADIDQLAEKIIFLVNNKETRSGYGGHSHAIAEQFQRRAHGDFINELMPDLRS
jgi:glycosyltransferase involved in cell wall biosynthesis